MIIHIQFVCKNLIIHYTTYSCAEAIPTLNSPALNSSICIVATGVMCDF